MKNLNDYISESLLSKAKDTILSHILVKLFNASQVKYLEKEHKWLQEFIIKEKKYIQSHFNVNDQENTGYILYEYGLLGNINRVADIVFDKDYTEIKMYSDKLKKAIKTSKHFVLSNDEKNFWYMPGFEIIGIDFKDIDEAACIKSADDLYSLN